MIGILFWLSVLFIVYTYAGYPLLLTLLARTRKPRPPYPDITPTVTILIAAYNEEQVIAHKIENCLALDYPSDKLQILVLNDASDDRTAEIVNGYAQKGVELYTAPKRVGKLINVNHGVTLARGEIVLISDATNLYAPDALRHLVKPFSDPRVGGAFGSRQIVRGDGALGDSEGLYWKYESFIQTNETRLGTSTNAFGDIFAIRRELYEAPPPGVINDDFILTMRLLKRGSQVIYAPLARTYERISPSAQDEITRRSRMIAGRYQAIFQFGHLLPLRRPMLVWQILSHKFFRPLVPFAMLLALFTNLAAVAFPPAVDSWRWLWLAPPFNWVLLGLQVLFYLLAWAAQGLERTNTLARILYLPTFLVNSNFAAVAGLIRFLRGRQTSTWTRVPRRNIQQ